MVREMRPNVLPCFTASRGLGVRFTHKAPAEKKQYSQVTVIMNYQTLGSEALVYTGCGCGTGALGTEALGC